VQIEFCIPHLFCQGSNFDENRRAKNILITTAETIQGSCGKRGATIRNGPAYCVTFDLPHCFDSASDPVSNAVALQALLHCLGAINLIFLQMRPGCIPALYDSGVYYERTTVWDSIPALYRRGFGDCKSLTAALVAEYAAQGIKSKPVFRWMVDKGDNQTNYHILVQTSQGFEDPSKVLGMEKHENAYFKRTG
jgi:hypothetical protein